VKLFTVELTLSNTHRFEGIEANTAEEAVMLAEEFLEDGDEGEVIETEQVAVDAYPEEEL
jgi:hypothetical protein